MHSRKKEIDFQMKIWKIDREAEKWDRQTQRQRNIHKRKDSKMINKR